MATVKRRQCRKCLRQRAERFFVSARGHVCVTCRKATQRTAARKQRVAVYDITPAEYEALRAHQGGVCGICDQPRTYNLHVDHDHKVEREQGSRASVRGLLCRRCNKLLAVVGDSIDLLNNAADYLAFWPSREVLVGSASGPLDQ